MAELHGELAALAEVDPRWWLLAGGAAAAEPWPPRERYVISDAEPGADTFIGYRAPVPDDPLVDAIARARAARQTVRELDGQFPDQPLAVTVRRTSDDGIEHARAVPTALDVAAFAIGDQCIVGSLDDPELLARLRVRTSGGSCRSDLRRPQPHHPMPFVCVSVGDDPLEVARHAHRRAWSDRGGPWLGLGRTGALATVSTCHFVVDGYGHARIAARIAQLAKSSATSAVDGHVVAERIGPLLPIPGAIPLGVAWRELVQPVARAIPMAYALGRVLHRRAGSRDARFSPTLQIPIAPGHRDDPMRWHRRVVPALASVRFDGRGEPEPFAVFEARVR
jgi:hypothetical protein